MYSLCDYLKFKDYIATIDKEENVLADKIKKMRQTLNSINDEIKTYEREHQGQVDELSAQKKLLLVMR